MWMELGLRQETEHVLEEDEERRTATDAHAETCMVLYKVLRAFVIRRPHRHD